MKKSYIVFSFFLLITVFGSLVFSTSKVEASRWGAPAYPNYSSNYSNMGYGYGNSYSRWGSNGYYFPSQYPENNNYGYDYNGYSGYNNYNYYDPYSYNGYGNNYYNPYSYNYGYNDYGYNNYGYNGYNGSSGFGFNLCLFGC